MGILKHFKAGSREFSKQWPSYLLLFISLNIVLQLAIVFFNGAAAWILRIQDIPYLSYTNLIVLVQKPIATILLLILFLLLIATVFFQFTYLLLGMRQIAQHRFNIIQLLKDSWHAMFRQTWKSVLFLLVYFLIILQASQIVFGSQLLGKIVIPSFIVDFLLLNPVFALLLLVAALLVGYIAIRLIFVLPYMVIGKLSSSDAVRKSLNTTHRKFWRYTIQLWTLGLLTAMPRLIAFGLIFVIQTLLDQLANPIALMGGLINLSAIQILNVFFSAWASMVLLSFLLSDDSMKMEMEHIEPSVSWRTTRWMKIVSTSVISMVGIVIIGMNMMLLLGIGQTMPITISHRGVDGVDNPNGAQNTIPALVKTSQLKPDYVEMDIQETKDGQFVVMHDPNLKNLTGVDGAPQDFTLKQLTRMRVRENGFKASVPSFDDYLEAANRHNQKLLVEVKTSKKDSKDLMKNFLARYQDNLLEHGHKVQSLDYNVVASVKENAPKLYVSYILPYNFVYPHTDADAYTMEVTTLNGSFTSKAHAAGRQVYAWTVNDSDTMQRMLSYHVDGIITDELSLVQKEIKQEKENPSYAQRIQDYVLVMPAVSSGTAS